MGFFQQPSYPNPGNVTQQLMPSPGQAALGNAATGFVTSQIGQPAQPYTGQLTAPVTPQQTALINQQAGLAGMSVPTEMQGLGTLGQYAAGGYLNDPTLANALGATAAQAQQQFASGIQAARAPFVAAGQTGFSSPEEAALGQGAATFATGLQSNLANQVMQNRLAQQGMQLQAAQQGAALPMQAQQQALAAAGIPQATQQAGLTAQYQDWLRQLQGAWQALQVPGVGNLLAQQGFQNVYPNVYGQSPFQSLLGGVTSLAGPAAYALGGPAGGLIGGALGNLFKGSQAPIPTPLITAPTTISGWDPSQYNL